MNKQNSAKVNVQVSIHGEIPCSRGVNMNNNIQTVIFIEVLQQVFHSIFKLIHNGNA